MNQGIQSHLKHKQLHHFGCYLLSLIQAANQLKDYTEDEPVALYNKFYEAGYIQRACTVLDPVAIFNSIAEEKMHTLTIIRDCKGKEPPANAIITIYEMYNPNTGYTHFTLPCWDPLNPARKAAKFYKLKGYRVLS